MDLDKLSLKPSEIDKNTGRIVLPKSQEELDRLSGRIPGMQVSTRVKAYVPGAQRPTFPLPGTQQLPAAVPQQVSHPPFWQHPFFGILGFCALVATFPIGFFCASIISENRQLTGQVNTLENKTAFLQSQKSSSNSAVQAYASNALYQEMQQIRNDVAQLSTSGIEVYLEEEIPQVIESSPAAAETPTTQPGVSLSDPKEFIDPVPQSSIELEEDPRTISQAAEGDSGLEIE